MPELASTCKPRSSKINPVISNGYKNFAGNNMAEIVGLMDGGRILFRNCHIVNQTAELAAKSPFRGNSGVAILHGP